MLVGQFSHHGRQVAVDVVKVDNVGLEVVEHGLEALAYIAASQRALQRAPLVAHAAAKVHLAGEPVLVVGLQVLGVLHRKHLSLHAVLTEQSLGVEDNDTVAASGIIKLIDQEYAFSHRQSLLVVVTIITHQQVFYFSRTSFLSFQPPLKRP